MTPALGLPERLRRAAGLGASPWIAGIALAAGALIALAVVHLLPTRGGDVAAARELGIVSVSILADYSKAAESRAFMLALAGAIATSVGLWTAWAAWAGRSAPPVGRAPSHPPSRVTRLELSLAAGVALLLAARLWSARYAWHGTWVFLAEEGEVMAWVDTVLRGGALSRDVFCLYGPISTWGVAGLFAVFGASLGVWRRWIFGLNGLAALPVYLLLRGLVRSRVTALLGALTVVLLCSPAVPAMSWSLARVGFGLGALAALTRALELGTTRWRIATGTLLAVSLLFSQEVGIACSLAAGLSLLLAPEERLRSILYVGAGGVLVLAPVALYLVATQSLAATVDNLFLFPRVRLLGFGAYPFPPLEATAESLRTYFLPVVLAVSAFATATRLLQGARDPRTLTEVALFVFGVLLFSVALSRPDETHIAFAAPPTLVLLAGMLEDAAFALRVTGRRASAAVALGLAAAALWPWLEPASTNLQSFFARAPANARALSLPRAGDVLLPAEFAADLERITREIQVRTAPNEPFLAYPNEGMLYFLADRPLPTRYPLVTLAVTREQRQEMVSELDRTRPRWAVLYLYAAVVDGIPHETAQPEIFQYINATYELEGNFGAFALLRRRS